MSGRGIEIRRVSITDPRDMPTKGIAETPGGTCFGTTPGGTRIIYDRLFLLRQKQTPAARTPPTLPQIPGVTRDLDESHATGDHPKDRRVSVIEEATEEASNEQQDESQSNEKQNEDEFQEAQVEDDVLDDECDMEM